MRHKKEYVYNEDFDNNPDKYEKFEFDLQQHTVDKPCALHVLNDITNSTSSRLLKPEYEQIIFLKYNYLRYKYVKHGKKDKSLAQQITDLRNHILNSNIRLTFVALKNLPSQQAEELIADSIFVLIKCIDNFNAAYNFKFSTYAINSLVKLTYTSKKERNRIKASTLTDNTNAPTYNKDITYYENNTDIDTILNHCPVLTQQQKNIILQRYGINCEKMTLQEIADIHNVTKERIRQIQVQAEEALQKYYSRFKAQPVVANKPKHPLSTLNG